MSLSVPRPFGHDLPRQALHPVHVFLLGGAACFYVSGFFSDWAYFHTLEIQWKNFASWLIMGGLVFSGVAIVFAVAGLLRVDGGRGTRVIYLVLLLAAWGTSLVNELIHAKDAWASMPEGLVLSAVVAIASIVATWLGFSTLRRMER